MKNLQWINGNICRRRGILRIEMFFALLVGEVLRSFIHVARELRHVEIDSLEPCRHFNGAPNKLNLTFI